ncbi:hypothetical protein D3C75_675240 [compost metagenome]
MKQRGEGIIYRLLELEREDVAALNRQKNLSQLPDINQQLLAELLNGIMKGLPLQLKNLNYPVLALLVQLLQYSPLRMGQLQAIQELSVVRFCDKLPAILTHGPRSPRGSAAADVWQ